MRAREAARKSVEPFLSCTERFRQAGWFIDGGLPIPVARIYSDPWQRLGAGRRAGSYLLTVLEPAENIEP